ncbi:MULTISPECIES: proline--tRNA ligase [Thermodesulfovibrio]|uniref:Proline--tRNA ligase n=1 Tax=Thermodesulfovibrio yellowstonii (strain ATCC 51303 / DSM 11347 / YP87) TaxID=289376 RepID=SYP_THEYD|nr:MULTISPECIES: proline--tRNA ligase [Thermodesulfovibrio]B5YKW0.1 RecName: Full=Proline--tRNA ligase; AltName: Full=Prolyl-tRNA synthetase; Short=ProRS [Thermodesulfovibrio yellowstonii DSM 11347]ACI20357.1 prolyl-tRNA synthetase [Thermodesulfovibrio yellowstonii DSM 11347]
MRYSKLFIPTMREIPSGINAISHILMLKAGYVRQLAAGLFIFLPLGWRVLNKINMILKEEMERIGAQEISMPILHPAEIWQETGRWYTIKEEMFRLKDRTGRDMCLGMTHEEIMTWIASKEIKSYRQLPQIWYQIQTKLRDEARPRGGVLRTREFIMKDSYSFDIDWEGLDKSYNLHAEAYHRIFTKCGLKYYQVESDPGIMGDMESHEFMAPTPAGEDEIVLCDSCGYSANIEVAKSELPTLPSLNFEYKEIYTPEKKSVKEVSDFLGLSEKYFIKTLIVISEKNGPVLVMLRGDQELNEKKLARIIGEFSFATSEQALEILGVELGFVGPVGHKIKKIADFSIQKEISYISGANKKNYHLQGIIPGIHFDAQWADIRRVKEEDRCPKCGNSLKIEKAIEVGNIFKLGTKYTEPLHAYFLDKDGKEKPIIMGSYGIGPARVAAAAIEQNHDSDGIIWPKSISPFDIEIIPLNMDDEKTVSIAEELYEKVTEIYNSFADRHMEVLIDDRDERPGVKFKDADLIGIPIQIVIGKKGLKENKVEIKKRRTKETKKVSVNKAVVEIVNSYYETY